MIVPARRRKKSAIEKEMEEAVEEVAGDKEIVAINKKLLKKQHLLSSGSTMVNLACTNTPHGFMVGGKYYLLVGESEAGKTWLSMSTLAESTLHPKFSKYRIIYDDIENGANMDMNFYFGEKTAARIEVPEPNRKDASGISCPYSETIEQFYDSLDRHLSEAEESGVPIIYVVDSMDSLSSEAEFKKVKENASARSKGKDTTGSYGDGKAKINSANIRRIVGRLGRSNSILIIVCQERDNLASMFDSKTFSGGRSLRFYATLQLWLKKRSDITATVRGKKRALGSLSEVNIYKNRLTGEKHKKVSLPIYINSGIDEVGSMIEWLLEEGYWSGGKTEVSKIDATDFGVQLSREQLARHIEQNELEPQLKEIVCDLWSEIAGLVEQKIQRKRRYE